MAPLRFRAWDKVNKEMFEVEGLDILTANYPQVNEVGRGWIVDVEDLVIMQSTGRHDKNGKEIFEGDIVKYLEALGADDEDESSYDHDRSYECQGVVKWHHTSASFYPVPQFNYCEDTWYSRRLMNFEVIGNIHENPELLEGG